MQTIAEFIATHGITAEIDGGTSANTLRAKRPVKDADGWEHYEWTVTLSIPGASGTAETLTTPYQTGIGIVRGEPKYSTITSRWVPVPPAPPTAEMVLDSMASDSSGYENARGFEDWCSDYGYDTDSRKAERLYQTVAEQAKALRFFLGREAYESLLWDTQSE